LPARAGTGTLAPARVSSPSGIGFALEALEQGTAVEREAVLEGLRARAAADPADSQAAREYARALAVVGRTSEAVQIFRELVERHPDDLQFEADLAMAHLRFGNLATARHHLGRVAQHGSDELRRFAVEQLEALDRFELVGEEERRLRDAQLRVLRERVAREPPSETDVTILARKLLGDSVREQDVALRDEAVAALERARAADPDSVRVLELLVLFYSSRDPEGRLHQAMKDLERLQPESAVFDAVRGSERSAADYPLSGRAFELLRQMAPDDPAIRAGVLHDLGALVAASPENGTDRIVYALALTAAGQADVAREQALIAVNHMDDDYVDHFNVTQVFLGVGDLEHARVHAERAVALAGDDAERRDAEALVARARGDA
jgi:tetratricopeptide (TPR) repeat protein